MQQTLRFSTDALPERDRLAIWSEVLSRYIVKVEVDRIGDGPYSQSATLRGLPGLSLASLTCTGFRVRRTRQLIADGNDHLDFVVNVSGNAHYRQLGREAEVASLQGVLLSNADEGTGVYPATSQHLVIGIPRESIAAFVRDPEAHVGRRIPDSDVLQLIISYIRSTDTLTLDSPGLAQAFATHLQDLMVLALGAAGDGRELARGRGLRAARLAAIKLDVRKFLGRADLSVVTVALRHGVTPRYVQKLFESEGTTFTAYVVERRLTEARRMLADPQLADHGIGDIALRCGFGDQPHFTRSFRRRFGLTPSDARQWARARGAS
jgi:AraC-like DNA-binding protein